MKRFLCALLLAATPLADAVADGAKTTNARVTLVYQHELPNVAGLRRIFAALGNDWNWPFGEVRERPLFYRAIDGSRMAFEQHGATPSDICL